MPLWLGLFPSRQCPGAWRACAMDPMPLLSACTMALVACRSPWACPGGFLRGMGTPAALQLLCAMCTWGRHAWL